MEVELEDKGDNIWIKICSSTSSFKQFQDYYYFKYEPKFNGVFSRSNLLTKKDGEYVINLDDDNSKRIHWVLIFIERNLAVCFDSLGIEYIPQEVLKKIKDKSIAHNIFRTQYNESIMCGFYFITFIEYMLEEKTWLDYPNLFSPKNY